MKEDDISDSNFYPVEDAMNYLQLKRSRVSMLCRKYNVKKVNNRYQIPGKTLKQMRHRENQSFKVFGFNELIYKKD